MVLVIVYLLGFEGEFFLRVLIVLLFKFLRMVIGFFVLLVEFGGVGGKVVVMMFRRFMKVKILNRCIFCDD